MLPCGGMVYARLYPESTCRFESCQGKFGCPVSVGRLGKTSAVRNSRFESERMQSTFKESENEVCDLQREDGDGIA